MPPPPGQPPATKHVTTNGALSADGNAVGDLQGRQGVASPCGACPIRSLSVCSVLDNNEINRLADIVQTIRFAQGASIFDEGENATAFFNVTSGTVKLYKLMSDGRRQITGFLFAGDFLGLAVDDCYAYTAEAVSEAYVCRFPRSKLETLMEDFPHFQRRLFSMASNELAVAQDQMLLLGRKSAKEKIASFLLSLSKRAVKRGQPATPIPLPMGRADIADFLGLTTETVSRTFTQLKSSGFIRLSEGNRVNLADRDALEDMAEGT
jgi:CRP/FNR family transcriptional regulator, anaerobic regulatory protein